MTVTVTKSRSTSGLMRHVALIMALVLIGGAVGYTPRTAAQAPIGGRLRFLHGIPGAPAVDISIDKVVAARALEFSQATRFIIVTPGDHTVAVLPTGSATPVFQGKVSIAPGQAETVIAQGTAAAVEIGIYEDDLPALTALALWSGPCFPGARA